MEEKDRRGVESNVNSAWSKNKPPHFYGWALMLGKGNDQKNKILSSEEREREVSFDR